MKRLTAVILALLLCLPSASGAAAQPSPLPELVTGNTAFALELYRALRQGAPTGENLVFSPLSVSEALAMVYAGARGETAAQIARVLGFSLPQPALHEAFAALNRQLAERGNAEADPNGFEPARTLRVANGAWVEQSYALDPAFVTMLEQHYGAGPQQCDFKNAPDAARGEINRWVADQTHGRIPEILQPGAVTSASRLLLANALYFSASWLFSFDPRATREEAFTLENGEEARVSFMTTHADFGYRSGADYEVVELPYVGSGLSLVVILPRAGAFTSFEERLDGPMLARLVTGLPGFDIVLHVPPFRADSSAELAAVLSALGMPAAFDPDRADFGGAVNGPTDEPLFISRVIHAATISVDEKGTEATAATVIGMVAGAAPDVTPPTPLDIRVDRPFIFAIRDTETGAILFLGRVMDPRAA